MILSDAHNIKIDVNRLVRGTVVSYNGIYGHLTGFAYNANKELMIKADIPTLDFNIFHPDELVISPQ